jgi:HEAT repeat protein
MSPTETETRETATLVQLLRSPRWRDRIAGERGFERAGPDAIPELVFCLTHPDDQVRWGAAKVLRSLPDARAAGALAAALEDMNGGVRWLASDALIAIGPAGVTAVLRRLISHADSPWLQEGAHRVLSAVGGAQTAPVIRALEAHFPEMTVPVAASSALRLLAPLSAEWVRATA